MKKLNTRNYRRHDRMPGQTLKKKKYILASIVLICVGFDWLLLWFCRDAFFMLLGNAPYLPVKYVQEYTHLKTLHIRDYPRHGADIHSIAFSPDNQRLAAAASKSIHILEVKTGEHLSALKTQPRWAGRVAFSPDGKMIASVSSQVSQSHRVQNLRDLRDILFLAHRKKQDRLSGFHRALFTDYTLEIRDIKTGKKRLTFPAETLPLKALDFSPDGRKLLLTTLACTLEVYEAITGKHLQHSRPVRAHNAIENTYAVATFAFSPDGKIFASGGRNNLLRPGYVADAEIQLWNIDTGLPLQILRSPGGRIRLLAFSPDSKILASACGRDFRGWLHPDYPNKIYIWDVENHRLLSVIHTGEVGERSIRALRFAPDNKTLASGHIDGRIHLWNITGETKIK